MGVKMQASIFFTGAFCALLSSGLHAEYDSAALGKLFTDKSQRAQIDALRSGSYTGEDIQQSSEVKLSGYVTRSEGEGVVWINNKSTLENLKVGDVKVHQPSIGKNKKVTISVGGKTAKLKPGETWYKETGRLVDNK